VAWQRVAATVLVAAIISMGVAPRVKATPGGSVASGVTMAAVNWVDELKTFVVFYTVGKMLDSLLSQARWQRILYGGACTLTKWALRDSVEEAIRKMSFNQANPPTGLVDRITDRLHGTVCG
jgi:hypothetical protein